jgi:hypothetical protein
MNRLDRQLFQAMSRLARSCWGAQGIGRCADGALWIEMVHEGYARPVKSQGKFILALTVNGWRALEAERQARRHDKQEGPGTA